MNKSEKKNLLIFICIALFLAYAIYYSNHTDELIRNSKTYTIARIERVQAGGRGCATLIDISFSYNNKKYRENKNCDSGIDKSFEGRHIFIKIVPSNIERAYKYNVNYTVPDSINEAPLLGWSEDWMKIHFPNFLYQ